MVLDSIEEVRKGGLNPSLIPLSRMCEKEMYTENENDHTPRWKTIQTTVRLLHHLDDKTTTIAMVVSWARIRGKKKKVCSLNICLEWELSKCSHHHARAKVTHLLKGTGTSSRWYFPFLDAKSTQQFIYITELRKGKNK